MGVKLREQCGAACTRQSGRYLQVAENLCAKEVAREQKPSGERLIVCYNPREAEQARERMVSQLGEMIGGKRGLRKKLLMSSAARREVSP